MQHEVPDTADSIVFATEGNVEGLKRLFTHGFASPNDVSNTRRFSLIRVRCSIPSALYADLKLNLAENDKSQWALYGGMHQFETVRFLISQGAPIDRE